MDLSAAGLFTGLVVGTTGFALFMYGRKQERMPHLAAGLALMVFPYFAPGAASTAAIAAAVLGFLWLAVRAGH